MQVIVRDRQEGKTTELVKWLLGGTQRQKSHPQWDRALGVADRRRVVYTSRMVQEAIIARGGGYLCKKSPTHFSTTCRNTHNRTREHILKAVWTHRELMLNIRGGELEYAIDDAEQFIFGGEGFVAVHPPTIIALTGQLYVAE